jgi:hypothetical protein
MITGCTRVRISGPRGHQHVPLDHDLLDHGFRFAPISSRARELESPIEEDGGIAGVWPLLKDI